MFVRSAVADEAHPTAALVWNLPEGCLTAADIERDVEQRLNRAVFVEASAAEVTLEVHEEDSGAGGTVLEVRDARRSRGTRSVQPTRNCNERRRTVALVAAMLLDAPADEPEEKPVETPQPAPVTPSSAPAPISRDVLKPPSRREQSHRPQAFRIGAGALAAVHLGLLPRFGEGGFGEVVAGLLHGPRGRVTVGGFQGATVATSKGAVDFSAFDASLSIVPIVLGASGSVQSFGWLGVSLDGVFASPSGFDLNHGGATWLASGVVGAAVQVEILDSGVIASGELELAAPFSRPQFLAQQDARSIVLYRTAALGGFAAIGVGWRMR
jgi:hypothetical protein